jgi:hypothetical protein
VLADQSARYAPTEWARTAIALYRQHKADRIVAEVNNGGDMVEATIRMVDPNVSYNKVHASRGKVIRAGAGRRRFWSPRTVARSPAMLACSPPGSFGHRRDPGHGRRSA